jgi:hypothetical protein
VCLCVSPTASYCAPSPKAMYRKPDGSNTMPPAHSHSFMHTRAPQSAPMPISSILYIYIYHSLLHASLCLFVYLCALCVCSVCVCVCLCLCVSLFLCLCIERSDLVRASCCSCRRCRPSARHAHSAR